MNLLKTVFNNTRFFEECMQKNIARALLLALISVWLLAACVPVAEQPSGEAKLQLVATTTIVGDVVAQVGGEWVDLSVLLPVGTDPHAFDPNPQDIAKVVEADLIFANGVGLESFLDNLIEGAAAEAKLISVSEAVDLLFSQGNLQDHDADADQHAQEGADPHTWTNPNNVIIWVQEIEQALKEADPENAAAYTANAAEYISELEELDTWIRAQVAMIHLEKRSLITDHTLFGYFVHEYGFEQVGTLIPGYSTLAEPTAQELAEIEDIIRELEVKAIFVGKTANPGLAERVADDLGVELVHLYTGSLSEAGGDAASYIEYMRYNTSAIVDVLK
jgi:ABC-type Zn uptake system ZnuABC Zn-binding protein ZnuA